MKTPSEKLPVLTQDQVDAMDETFGYIPVPADHGADMRALAIFSAPVANGLANGTLGLVIEEDGD